MAHTEDISIDQGTDVDIELTLANYDKTVKNLNGYGLRGSIKTNLEADSDNTFDFSYYLTSPLEGIVTLSLTADQTSLLDHQRRYVYDVELLHDDPDTGFTIFERVLQGVITVVPSVTRLNPI